MTEVQWPTGTAGVTMFRRVAGKLSRRRLLLLGVAVHRRMGESDPAIATTLAVLERYAEGAADEAALRASRRKLQIVFPEAEFGLTVYNLLALDLVEGVERLLHIRYGAEGEADRQRDNCDLIREIAGNPFRPWKTVPETMGGGLVQPDGQTVRVSAAARAVAEGIAADGGFDRLPVLADALEDGGVTDAELLAHCRRPGGHLRGCWAVDVVLGRG